MPDQEPPRKPRGFLCPDCGVKLKQVRTLRPVRFLVVRHRRCPKCGHRLTTEERPRVGSGMVAGSGVSV